MYKAIFFVSLGVTLLAIITKSQNVNIHIFSTIVLGIIALLKK